MARGILIEEFHLTVRAPRGLPEEEYEAIRRTLDDRQFQSALRRSVREVCSHYPTLANVQVTLTR